MARKTKALRPVQTAKVYFGRNTRRPAKHPFSVSADDHISKAIAVDIAACYRVSGRVRAHRGVYAPAAGVIAANCKNSPAKNGTGARNAIFTERQTAILDILFWRHGKFLCSGFITQPNRLHNKTVGLHGTRQRDFRRAFDRPIRTI
jgi:hypothetical protein